MVPEETIGIAFARQRHTEVSEVVAVAVRVKACIGEFFPGQGGNLTVFSVILEKFADLFPPEIFSVAPGVNQNAQPHFVRSGDDGGDIRTPEIEVELRHGKDHCRASVVEHFLKIPFGMFHIIEAVVTDGCLSNCH